MAVLIPIVVAAVASIAIEKATQAITGQPMSRTTIPLGPFRFQVGAGKPSYGFGAGIPGTPLNVGVMAGPGRKPTWEIGATFKDIDIPLDKKGKRKLSFGTGLGYSWTGSRFAKGTLKPQVSVSLKHTGKGLKEPPKKIPVGTKIEKRGEKYFVVEAKTGKTVKTASNTTRELWELGLKGEYDIANKKYGIELVGEKDDWMSAKIRLTKPKRGDPYITLGTVFKKTRGEMKGDFAVGVTLGKGKPIWEFDTDIDLGKEFSIEFGKEFGKQIDKWKLGVTKYRIPDPEKGLKEKQVEVTYRYNTKNQKGYFAFDTGLPIPVKIDLGQKESDKRVVINTDSVANYITQKLMPDPYAKTWKEKIDYGLQEAMLKGINAIRGKDIPESLKKALAAIGFGGERGIVFQKAISDDYLRFGKQLMPESQKGLKEWQAKIIADQLKLTPGFKVEDYPYVQDWIEFPADEKLLRDIATGEKSWKDFFLGRSAGTLDMALANIKDRIGMEEYAKHKTEYLGSLQSMDPNRLADSLHDAIRKSRTREELVENMEKDPKGWDYWMQTGENAWNELRFIASGLGYGALKLPQTTYNIAWGGPLNPLTAANLASGELKDLFTEEQKMVPTAFKTVTWDVATRIYDWFHDILAAGPYTQEQYDVERIAGNVARANEMAAANARARQKAFKDIFRQRPVESISNIALVGSGLLRTTSAAAKLSGMHKLETGSAKAAAASETILNPWPMIGKGMQRGISSVARSRVGDTILKAIGKIKSRRDIGKIYNEYKAASLLESSRMLQAEMNAVKKAAVFTPEEKWDIIRASQLSRGRKYDEFLPGPLKGNPHAHALADSLRSVSDEWNLYALQHDIYPIEQLEARGAAPLIAHFEKLGRKGMTPEQLRLEGYELMYFPERAAAGVTAPESALSKYFSALKQVKQKPYVGEIPGIAKLDPSVAIQEHGKNLSRLAALQKTMQDLKKLPYVRKFDPRKDVLGRGESLVDIDGTIPFLQKQQDFLTDFTRNMQILQNPDEAMALTLEKWTSLGKTQELIKAFKGKEVTLYRLPDYQANILRSNFRPLQRIPIWDDLTDAVRDSVLGYRTAWVLRDLTNNSINYLLSGRNPAKILEAMKKEWEPLFPSELLGTGIAADIMFKGAPAGLYGRLETAIARLTKGVNAKFKKAIFALDKAQDDMFKKGFFFNDLERFARRKVMEDTAKSYFLAESELKRLSMTQLRKWAAKPELYAAEAGAASQRIMSSISDWIYSYNNVFPLLTAAERTWMKRALFFPEIAYWGAKKLALLPIKYPVQTKILDTFARMQAQWDDPKDKPDYLVGAEQIADNYFLRLLAGTIYDPEYGGLSYQGTGMLNPTLKTVMAIMTGVDPNTGRPYTSKDVPWKYNPETNQFEPIKEFRAPELVEQELTMEREKLETNLKRLDEVSRTRVWTDMVGLDFENILSQIEYGKKNIYTLETELEAVRDIHNLTLPAVMERIAKNFPQYQWFEDALVPFRKYGDFTWQEPEIIKDDQGNPKYPISRWLLGLQMLGLPISQVDIEAWRNQEAQREKREISVNFRDMLDRLAREDPDKLIDIVDAIEQNQIPFEIPGWSESQFFTMPVLEDALEVPTADQLAFREAVEDARKIELEALDIEKANALEMAEAISPEFVSKMRDAINALTKERRQMLNSYYDAVLDKDVQLRLYQQALGMEEIAAELKRLRDQPVDTYDIIKQTFNQLKAEGIKVKGTISGTRNIIDQFFSDLISADQETDIGDIASIFAFQLGVKASDFGNAMTQAMSNLFNLPANVATQKAKDEWFQDRVMKLAFDAWKKEALKTTEVPKELIRLTPDLEQELANDIIDYYTLGIDAPFEIDPEKLTGEEELFRAIEDIEYRTSEALTKLKEIEGKLDPNIQNMIIKGVVDMKEKLIKQTRRKYKTKQRMQTLFTQERVEAAEETLERAIEARRDFLGQTSYQSWQDFFDPQLMKENSFTPLTTWLTALAAARVEGYEKLGKEAFESFLETDEGKSYTNFETELLDILEALTPTMPQVQQSLTTTPEKTAYEDVMNAVKEYTAAYKAYGKAPTMSSFKDLYGLHERAIATPHRIPVIKFDEARSPIAAFDVPKDWGREAFETKFQELDKYSRTFASPEYRTYETQVEKSLKTLQTKWEQGGEQARFIGVLLQK